MFDNQFLSGHNNEEKRDDILDLSGREIQAFPNDISNNFVNIQVSSNTINWNFSCCIEDSIIKGARR